MKKGILALLVLGWGMGVALAQEVATSEIEKLRDAFDSHREQSSESRKRLAVIEAGDHLEITRRRV